MATISEFRAAMGGGGARGNQFRVELSFPTIVASGNLASQSAQFLCRAASLPGSTLNDIPVAYRGRTVHVAGDRDFAGWAVTILNDTDFLVRNAFEQWMNAVNNHATLGGETSSAAYQTDLIVRQLDKNDAILKSYTLVDAYPVALGEIQLSHDAANQIEQFDINFVFNYWTSDTTS